MLTLNGKTVLQSGSVIFTSGDTARVTGVPPLSFRETQAQPASIKATGTANGGFDIDLQSFSPGLRLVWTANANTGAQAVIIQIVADRVGEIGGKGFYIVNYQVTEA